MSASIETTLPVVLASAAVIYLGLAVFVARSSPRSVIGLLFFLFGITIAGSAFYYGTSDARLYDIGRVLYFFSGGFIPVAWFAFYRQYTVGPARRLTLIALSIVPAATALMALTNPLHNMLWAVVETPDGPRFSALASHWWYSKVYAPFEYGLFGYSVLALLSRLSTIATGHRRNVAIMVVCALLPYAAGVANIFFGIGSSEFPVLASSLVLLLPVYAYVVLSLRVTESNPLVYDILFDHVRDPIFALDTDGRIICVNRKAVELLGLSENKLLGRRLWEDFPEARTVLREAGDLDLTQTLRIDQDQIFEVSVTHLKDSHDRAQGSVVVCRDVTGRRRALDKLARSEQQIRTLIETSSNGVLRFSRDLSDPRQPFRCVFANRAAADYLHSERHTLVGMSLEKLQQLDPPRLIEHFGAARPVAEKLSFEIADATGGSDGWFRVVGEAVGRDFSVTLVDITQWKHNESKMLADAIRDSLTGVLNRRGFENAAVEAMRNNTQGAVLYLDLNKFKAINDRLGHQAGDALLKAFGHRLEFCLRPGDVLGRLGGDEFVIVLPGVDLDDAKHVAERLVKATSEAYIIQGEGIHCAASVGIALMPRHGEELWHLVSVADEAMYSAKAITADHAANDLSVYVSAAVAS